MEDRKGEASICSRHAHPGHPHQSMVRRRCPEAPSCSKVGKVLEFDKWVSSFQIVPYRNKNGVPKLSIHSKFG